jgi:hypothetical protein
MLTRDKIWHNAFLMSSIPPESEFDLEKLFLPAWAQGPPSVNKYAGFAGEDRPPRDYGERPGGRRPPRRDFDRQGARPKGGRPQDRPARQGGPRERGEAPVQREEPAPPPQVALSILPDEKGVESLARQIRVSGRAYPLFAIAQLILQKPERQQIRFEVIKKPDGTPAQPLFLCALDDTLWLSEDQAANHLLNRHFNTFYQAERTATDPPRGTYTFVAQCGISGTILGPPNHHDYQNQLRKLHAERFARMPFEAFKARVKIVKDETVVKKWIEDQSFKTEYNCLNVPEALKLPSREEVEKHFRQVHFGNIVKPVESHTLSGPAARQLRCPDLQRLLRMTWEEQRRFPLKVATTLSQQFGGHGLQFFKVNRTVTHVSVARPHFLDLEATPVSEGVKRIVDYINTHPKCTRRKLIETLAPAPAAAPAAPATQDPQGTAGTAAEVSAPAPAVEASPEQAALAGDLHWLIHQGHVIEFANGVLDTAKRPLPKPPKPGKKAGAAAVSGETSAAPAEVAASDEDSLPAVPADAAATLPATEAPPSLPSEEEEAVTTMAEEQKPASAPEDGSEASNKLA